MTTTIAKLFTNKICPFAQRAEITAAFKGFKGDIVHVGLRADMPEWYKKDINYREEVPAVQLSDGSCFSESAMIVQLFDDTISPKGQLYPANAELRRQINAFAATVQPFIGAGFASLRAVGDEELTLKNNALRVAISRLERSMSTTSPFALGDTFSYADVLLAPFVIRFSCLLKAYSYFSMFNESPRLKRFMDACLAIPAVASTTPPAEWFISEFGKIGYASNKPFNWQYKLFSNPKCPYCERVALTIAQITRQNAQKKALTSDGTVQQNATDLAPFFATETIGLYKDMPAMFKEYVNPDEEIPVLRLPTGEHIKSSLEAAAFLAETFAPLVSGIAPTAPSGADVPLSSLSTADPRKMMAGRYFVDSAMRAFAEVGGSIYRRERGFAVADEVAFELRNADRVFAEAAGTAVEKTYLFGDEPSYFDFQVLPFLNRFEMLQGEAAVAALIPNLARALKAARADAVLSKELASEATYFGQ